MAEVAQAGRTLLIRIMHTILKDLNWRYATKRFDPDKPVSEENLHIIKESLRLAATSYGLQPLKFIIVESPELRERLKTASYGQSQITDAAHIIVICSFTDLEDAHVDAYMKDVAAAQSLPLEETSGFGDYVKQVIAPLSTEEKASWNSRQAYIALGQVMHTCASLRVDATPMEGFDPLAYDEILGLKKQNLKATLVCAVGYRHADDEAQHRTKVRRSAEDMFDVI
ncbi:MAG: nitroreductase [Flavobacteriaceae bacterium]